jgi:hypothetical protein
LGLLKLSYTTAQLQSFIINTLENKELDIVERLPQFTENIRNPKVERALHEVRRLINSLIDKLWQTCKIVMKLQTNLSNKESNN